MYIVPIAWLYVALMMAVAEATSSQGTLLGAFFTMVLYGLLPIALVLYFMGTPSRRRQRQAREADEAQAYVAAQQAQAAPSPEPHRDAAPAHGAQGVQPPGAQSPASVQANTGHLPPGDLVAAIRKEP